MKRLLCVLLICQFAPIASWAGSLPPICVLCVGDSTVSTYPEAETFRGWGQMLPKYFRPEVTWKNSAAGGRSSRSFYDTGLWKKALTCKPDFIFIQFGHNDRAKDERGTDPQTTYKDYIRRYVVEARSAGATPILVGSMSPRAFSLKDGVLRSNVQPFAVAMREVAEEEKVPFIDLHEPSFNLFKSLGAEQSKKFAPKDGDINHFNAEGADLFARIISDGVSSKAPSLKPYLLQPDAKLAVEIP